MPKFQIVLWRTAGFVGLFAGLCAIFALLVTVPQAWQEHAEAQWPIAMARVENCGLDQTTTGRRDKYYIDCRLSYTVGAEQFVTRIYSGNAPSAQVWQYPPNQLAPLQDWVDAHPRGTPIAVHYDPANHKAAVLVAHDMPRGAPHTPDNLKLLEFAAATSLLLLTIARIARPKSPEMIG